MSATLDENMDGAMEEVDVDMEGDMENDGEEDEGPAPEFVKKEYFARPYESPYGTDKLIEAEKVRNSR